MLLIKDHWTNEDILPFQIYLKSLSKGKAKSDWESKIINTKLECIAVPSCEIKKISNQIYKGNYLEFINLWIWENYSNTAIIGNLISKIKDFNLFKKYLNIYSKKCDNWATCDILKFNVNKQNKHLFFDLASEYVKSSNTFVKRIGIRILFNFIKDEEYIEKIFNILNQFYNENQYYVNMANAWLLCECWIKQKQKTLKFFNNNKLNNFTINKAISKCRDSFRVSSDDKEYLLKFKK